MSIGTAIQEIITEKNRAGSEAYAAVDANGRVLLWSSEDESEGDDGRRAIRSWQVDPSEIDALLDTGDVGNM